MSCPFKIFKKVIYSCFIVFIWSCSNDDDLSPQITFFDEPPASEVSIFTNETQLGYTLVTPLGGHNTFLLDAAGFVVKEYPSSNTTFMAYLQPNGNLVRTYQVFNNQFDNNGETGGIEIIDTNGDVLWDYQISTAQDVLHHDIALLPNGNILAVVWYKLSGEEAVAEGRNPNLLTQGELHADKIIEIKPIGSNDAQIVWQWDSRNHFVQDFDSSKNNFGNVNQETGKLDINYSTGAANHTHINGIDYDPINDLILLSSRQFNEIWIIDHSTTTQEAASNTGGNANKGGELLYRFGNPETFNNGDETERILFRQHDATFIASENSLGGNILVFNNQVSDSESAALEFEIPYSGISPNGDLISNNMPSAAVWEYTSETIFSPFISGAQRLANGNTLITAGRIQRLVEVNEFGDIVFQMDIQNSGSIFKVRKYPIDYTGLPEDLMRLNNVVVNNN